MEKGTLVSGGDSAGPDSGGKVLSLDACVAAALSSSDDIAMADRSLDSARAQHALNASKDAVSLQALGGYGLTDGFGNPTILKSSLSGSALGVVQSIQGGLTVQKGTLSSANPATKIALTATQNLPSPNSSVDYNTTVVGVSVAQTIWDGYPGGQTKASVDKSFLALRIKEFQTVQSRAAALAAVKRAYITMLTAQRALEVKKSIAEKQRGLLNQIQTVYSLKQASSVDLLNAQINSESADLDVESGSHDLALARQRLAALIGMPADSAFAVSEVEDPPLPAASLEEAIAVGLKRRAELAIADLSRSSSAVDALLAKGQAQAGISLSGGVSMALASPLSPADAEYANLGVKITLPILDGGAARAMEASSDALLGVYATQRHELEKSVAADIHDAYWAATIQERKIELAKKSMELCDSQLALLKVQNTYGTATNQDLLTAAVNAANAEIAYATAKNGYLLAILSLTTAMGL
jgi:outer membrane protein